jgi:predicted ATPase
MKLTVKNLGAISHAEVDLSKDLILFTGENNTGKTYLTYTIYGLYHLTDLEINDLEDGQKRLKAQLGNIFATSKTHFKTTKINLEAGATQKLAIKPSYLFTAERSGINVFSKELSLIKGRLLSGLLKNGKNQALTDLLKDRINRYSEPIQDELEISERYDILQKKISLFNYLADELEKTFLNGRVYASESGDLRFMMDDSKKELEIHATSSTVKSLSPLVFYLRHMAERNDFIIIDKPEWNLHPDNQRKIARFIGRLIQEGFKVLVSTHSDYIVRELNNLIMLHSGTQQKPEIAQDLLKTHGYAANELLDKERVGVYLFRLGKSVENVPIDDAGFSVATIDEEANKLNQTSQDIYFNLFD